MNSIKSISFFISFLIFSQAQASVQSYFDQIKTDPNALYAFFKQMPKGGELHYHLAGGSYPETMLEIASQNNYCLNKETFSLTKATEKCTEINTKNILNQPDLYAKTIRIWSLQDFTPGVETEHDHFFNSFLKFMPLVSEHSPKLIADVIQRAANQQEQYMELMILPDNANSIRFGALLKNASSLEEKRSILLANKDFQKNIAYSIKESDRFLQEAHNELKCRTNPQNPACQVSIKFLYYSLREQPIDNLFAQTLNGFEAVAQSQTNKGSLVGVNLVQPEDGIISLYDYNKHMQIYKYLHQLYPHVNISLHAGELTQELVTPKDLNFHIHDALLIGQAERIGHGVDIAQEDDAQATLNYMAEQHKAVEINLVSNRRILNVTGSAHPLNYYLAQQVPVILSTDDEGILRTTLTAQYVEAVLRHGLNYQILKKINRNALTYAFAPGKSIWINADKAELTPECLDLNNESCKTFINNNEKGQLQWNLEQKLQLFESKYK